MINPKTFIDTLYDCGIEFYTGVPDSLLKSLCAYLNDTANPNNYIIAANEGAAVGLAAGYHLATGRTPVVFMQNSGIGNAVNPLMSLIDHDVYQIPVLLIIGWRGEPGVHDEPQHVKQGKVTLPMLQSMGIANCVLDNQTEIVKDQIDKAIKHIETTGEPFALVVRKGTFESYSPIHHLAEKSEYTMSREQAIDTIINALPSDTHIVSTTGMISRELFELREKYHSGHSNDFLTVGSMGHASQIALGIAINKPEKLICCLDGDGSTIMHMGSMAIVGQASPQNYLHIVLNNGAHDSVGGQPTVGFDIDMNSIAKACGYSSVYSVDDKQSLTDILKGNYKLPMLLEVRVKKGARSDLGRPTTTPIDNKRAFMQSLSED